MKIIMTSYLTALLVFGNLGQAVQGRLGTPSPADSDKRQEVESTITNVNSTSNSTASHSRALQAQAPSSVCVDGVFQPDITRYYTIADPTESVIWGHARTPRGEISSDNFDRPGQRAMTTLTNTAARASQDAAHWRFVQDASGKWNIVNRNTGFKMAQGTGRLTNGAATTDIKNPVSFVPTCDESGNVFFDTGSGLSGAFPRCGVDGCNNGAPVNMVPKPRIVTKRSGCVPITRPCSTIFGSGFTEISRDFIGFCGNKKTCRGPENEPNQLLPQFWSVKEVDTNFVKQKAIKPSAFPVSEEESALKAMGAEVALGTAEGLVGNAAEAVITTICEACSIALPLVSSVIGVSIGFLEEEEEPLAVQLANMAEATARLIDSSIVTNDIESGRQAMNAERTFYMQEYREEKDIAITTNSLDDEGNNAAGQRLASRLKISAQSHLVNGMQEFFVLDENAVDPRNIDIERAQEGFEYLKVAIQENLSMLLEAFLLDDYSSPEKAQIFSCEKLAKAAQLDAKAIYFKEEIEKNQELLFNRRVDGSVIKSGCDNAGFGVTDTLSSSGSYLVSSKFGNQERFRVTSVRAVDVNTECSKIVTIKELRSNEVAFDMVELSYRISELVEYLDGYFDNAVAICNEMRANDEFRTLFATRDGTEASDSCEFKACTGPDGVCHVPGDTYFLADGCTKCTCAEEGAGCVGCPVQFSN